MARAMTVSDPGLFAPGLGNLFSKHNLPRTVGLLVQVHGDCDESPTASNLLIVVVISRRLVFGVCDAKTHCRSIRPGIALSTGTAVASGVEYSMQSSRCLSICL